MGPSAIIPGSHILSQDGGDWSTVAGGARNGRNGRTDATVLSPALSEIKLAVPKGEGVAVHPPRRLRSCYRPLVCLAPPTAARRGRHTTTRGRP